MMALLGVAIPDGEGLAARRERLKQFLEPPGLLELMAYVRVLFGHHRRQLHTLQQVVTRERGARKVQAADIRQHCLGNIGFAEGFEVFVDYDSVSG